MHLVCNVQSNGIINALISADKETYNKTSNNSTNSSFFILTRGTY